MKANVVQVFEGLNLARQTATIQLTLEKLRQTISQPILSRVVRFREEGWSTVLLTAALDCYAFPLGYEFGFEQCLASPTSTASGAWTELSGDQKAKACQAWVASSASPVIQVAALTDHIDDLPLLLKSSYVVVQASGEQVSQIIEMLPATTSVEHIDPLAEQPGGGIWFWMMDMPSGPHDEWEARTILSKHRYALMYVGHGDWVRARPGAQLDLSVHRIDCPTPPSAQARVVIAARRKLVRDALQIFH